GGRENDVTLYAAETQQLVWEAKNVGQDKLHLRVPVSGSSGASSGDVFYAATAHKHVRLYDVRAGQRPVLSIDLDGDLRAAAIQPLSGDRLYVGDTAGGIGLWDLRRGKRTHVLKGAAGSIRHMQLGAGGSGGGETLACVGLDRFLRMYDANQKLSSAVYLKNRLNCCL
ncbi:quinon protein alcohol dehydrogenase-like superfamily, partial [Ochromonadaceae sp. CCMP2298]